MSNNDSFVNWLNAMPKEGIKAVTKAKNDQGRWKLEVEFNSGQGFILSNYILPLVAKQFDKKIRRMYRDSLELVCVADLAHIRALEDAKALEKEIREKFT